MQNKSAKSRRLATDLRIRKTKSLRLLFASAKKLQEIQVTFQLKNEMDRKIYFANVRTSLLSPAKNNLAFFEKLMAPFKKNFVAICCNSIDKKYLQICQTFTSIKV